MFGKRTNKAGEDTGNPGVDKRTIDLVGVDVAIIDGEVKLASLKETRDLHRNSYKQIQDLISGLEGKIETIDAELNRLNSLPKLESVNYTKGININNSELGAGSVIPQAPSSNVLTISGESGTTNSTKATSHSLELEIEQQKTKLKTLVEKLEKQRRIEFLQENRVSIESELETAKEAEKTKKKAFEVAEKDYRREQNMQTAERIIAGVKGSEEQYTQDTEKYNLEVGELEKLKKDIQFINKYRSNYNNEQNGGVKASDTQTAETIKHKYSDIEQHILNGDALDTLVDILERKEALLGKNITSYEVKRDSINTANKVLERESFYEREKNLNEAKQESTVARAELASKRRGKKEALESRELIPNKLKFLETVKEALASLKADYNLAEKNLSAKIVEFDAITRDITEAEIKLNAATANNQEDEASIANDSLISLRGAKRSISRHQDKLKNIKEVKQQEYEDLKTKLDNIEEDQDSIIQNAVEGLTIKLGRRDELIEEQKQKKADLISKYGKGIFREVIILEDVSDVIEQMSKDTKGILDLNAIVDEDIPDKDSIDGIMKVVLA